MYWKPVFHALCEVEALEVSLVNARHVKASTTAPGWLSCWSAGCFGGASSHPREIAAIRELTRYRKKVIESRTRVLHRLFKMLEDGGIKIDPVVSSITTLSARDMIEALIGGQRDPGALAGLARGVMRKKVPDLAA